MRIDELFEAHLGPMDPIEDKKEFFKVIDKVKQSDIYKRLLKSMDDVTGSVAERNGTIMLKPKDVKTSSMSQKVYKVQRNGQLRISNGGNSWSIQARLKSPTPDKDLYTRYVNALEEIEKKYYKRLTTKSGLITVQGHQITTLVGLNFENCSSVLIKEAAIKDLTGLPAINNLIIQDCHELESLNGIQTKTKNVNISNCSRLTSLAGIPKNLNTLSILDLPNLSLSKVNEFVNSVKDELVLDQHYIGPILSVLKIKKINSIRTRGFGDGSKTMRAIVGILNKYHNPEGTGNIAACQTELMKNGFKEYAKL